MIEQIGALTESFANSIQAGNFSPYLLATAFLGGVLASISPCTLGILPIIAGYIGGYDKEKNSFKTFVQLVSFVFGLSVILTATGIICAFGGRVFTAIGGKYATLFIASLIMVFGLNLLNIIEIPTPNFVKRMPKSNGASLFVYPFVLGFLFALASTPCSTPILASIMSFAALSKNLVFSALLLFLFSLGQGIIIILAGVFTSVLKNLKGFHKFSEILMKVCGILLIFCIPCIVLCGVFSLFSVICSALNKPFKNSYTIILTRQMAGF